MNLDYLPIDIMLEIFSRLPGKSIGRCRCVSKVWGCMLGRQDFREFLLTKSSARPRLVFAIELGLGEEVILFSTIQPQNAYNKSSSLVVKVADFDMKISKKIWRMECSYASGLIYLPNVLVSSKNYKDKSDVICNPSTGQYAKLPEIDKETYLCNFLGFDPIDNQFKVLYCFDYCGPEIVTLGTRKMSWRKIRCPLKHRPTSPGICINGVLYYTFRAVESNDDPEMIVCFDVRSEKFKFIEGKFINSWYDNKLINYKGRLGVINWMPEILSGVLCLWVLEDIEIQKWSKYVYPLPKNNEIDWPHRVPIVGMTATNNIILLDDRKLASSRLLHVFYYNTDMNTLQHVHIHTDFLSFEKTNGVFAAFVDHVEDFCFDIIKTISTCDHATTTTSSSTNNHLAVTHIQPDRRRCMFESINKFDALRLLLDDDHHHQFTGL